jgi:hypothetical protein
VTPALFRQIGEALYGELWRMPLSRDLDVSYLNVRRWASGDKVIPPGIVDELRRMLDAESLARQAALRRVEEARLNLNLTIHQEVMREAKDG